MSDRIDELKGELNVVNLQLKEKDFKFKKRSEDHENQIKKLTDENKNLKEKYEK